jgi:sugar phosphate isomerase/epimerase
MNLWSRGAAAVASDTAWHRGSVNDRRGLWWGTVEGVGIDGVVSAAATAGFSDISVTPAMYFAARDDGRRDRELRAMLVDHDVTVAMIDPLLRGLPGSMHPDRAGRRFRSTFEHDEDDCYRAADALGATAINVAHFLGAPTPQHELVDAIGAIARRARERGLDVFVEFMPEGSIPDLAAAAAVVAEIAEPNCGVMFDTWHHWRCAGDVEQVRALPAGVVRAVQLSDALVDVRGTGTEPPTSDRLLPGAGVIPLVELVRAARENNPSVVLGLEVFSSALAGTPPVERAMRARDAFDALNAAVNRS